MINANPHKVPPKWIWTQAGNVGNIVTGNTPPKNEPKNYGNYIPLVKPPELNDCLIESAEDYLSELGAIVARLLPPQSVLVSCIGNLGKTGINKIPVAFNQQINAIILGDGINPKYGFYYFQTSEVKKYLNDIASATTIPIVNKSKFETTPFPLSPLPEQHRIVTKIEELFTKLDAGVEALNKVKAQLKRYRQAVLKYAFEGKLTQEWREANKHKLEPASVLLERIKEERRKRLGGKFKELPPLGTTDLPELPREWVYVVLEDIISDALIGVVRSAHEQNKMGVGVPYIKMDKITMDGKVLLNDLVSVEASDEELQRYSIKEGDILFNTRNSVELVGKTGIVRGSIKKCIYNNNLMRIRTEDGVSSAFSVYQMCSSGFRKRMERVKRSTTNVAAIYAKDLFPLPFILPPTLEQIRMVEDIESRFSMVNEVEKIAEQALKQSEKLRQSVLKKAFEGNLVPQDPTDEPARELLERIKAEKAKKESETKGRRKKSEQMELI